MLGLPLPDIIAGLVVAIAFFIGLAMAYRRGYRAALPLRSDAFDFLAARTDVNGSRWQRASEQTGNANTNALSLPLTLEFQQAGSRLTGTGSDETGTVWHVEGVIHGAHLECLTRRMRGADAHLEVWMLRVDAARKLISGYWIGWDETGSRLALRELRWVRVETPREQPSDPNRSEQVPPLVAVNEST